MQITRRSSGTNGTESACRLMEREECGSDLASGEPPVKRCRIDPVAHIPSYLQGITATSFTATQESSIIDISLPTSIEHRIRLGSAPDEFRNEFASKSNRGEEKSDPKVKKSVRRCCKAIVRSHENDPVFEKRFSSKIEILKNTATYKDAALDQKCGYIESVEQEVKLEMASGHFVEPEPENQPLPTGRIVRLEYDHSKLVILEILRDVRKWYGEQAESFDPSVLRAAQQRRVQKRLELEDWKTKDQSGKLSLPSTGDVGLSFLKEKRSSTT